MMYKILTIKDEVRIPPSKISANIIASSKDSLEEALEGKIIPDIGVFLAIPEVLNLGEGEIRPGDGAIFYPVEFKALVFKPEEQEVLPGEVVDITEFGAFIRIGPLDGLSHISQLTNEKVFYDQKNNMFTCRKTKRTLKEGNIVRVRIVSVSLSKSKRKISLTMRQPWLGAEDWIEMERKKLRKKSKSGKKTK